MGFNLQTYINGSYHLTHSTLSIWKSGGKRNAVVTNTRVSDTTWRDETKYQKVGWFGRIVTESVKANNSLLDPSTPTAFRWTGTGLLRFLKADCRVIDCDEDMNYIILYFGPTALTQEGIDILSLTTELPDSLFHKAMATINSDPKLKGICDKEKLIALGRG